MTPGGRGGCLQGVSEPRGEWVWGDYMSPEGCIAPILRPSWPLLLPAAAPLKGSFIDLPVVCPLGGLFLPPFSLPVPAACSFFSLLSPRRQLPLLSLPVLFVLKALTASHPEAAVHPDPAHCNSRAFVSPSLCALSIEDRRYP